MSVPPDLMKPPAGGAPMPQEGSPADGAPGAAGMLTPQKPAGQLAGAKVQVLSATKVLTRALADLEPKSPEYDAVLAAITKLSKAFGKDEDESEKLMPAELGILQQALAGPGAAGPGAPPGGGGDPPQMMPPGGKPG
jgi:hypothetical protein